MLIGFRRWWYNWTHPTGLYPWRWRMLTLWIIVFSLFVAWTVQGVRNSSQHNRSRIVDIQQSRLNSCRTTYESIRQVFKPFFSPKANRTPKQQHDIDLFNSTINDRKAKCIKQVQTTLKEIK